MPAVLRKGRALQRKCAGQTLVRHVAAVFTKHHAGYRQMKEADVIKRYHCNGAGLAAGLLARFWCLGRCFHIGPILSKLVIQATFAKPMNS
jgi:hypothetical protein